MKNYFKGFSLLSGVVRYNDLCYLLATMDELIEQETLHTRIYELDRGNWGGEDFEWPAISADVCYFPEERFIAISPMGRVQVFGGGQIAEEKEIKDKSLSPSNRGPLREVRGIAGGKAYAVGTCRQAYRRDAPGKWVCIDKTAQKYTDQTEITDTCFESIDGFSENDIYAVGWEGEIWHYDGKKWTQKDSPTNIALYKVKCGGDGYVYACGQLGIIIRGRDSNWEIIPHEATQNDLRGLEWFQDALYISSSTDIYRLDGNSLIQVNFPLTSKVTFYHLSARDGIMWSIGAKDVMQFDGKQWTAVLNI